MADWRRDDQLVLSAAICCPTAILVFANGAYMPDLHHSKVFEIDPATNKIVWEYMAADDMTSFFSPHMSGAQRLPSGNTLICEGNKGCLIEVTPEGEIVREFVSPHFVVGEMFGASTGCFARAGMRRMRLRLRG